MAVKGVFTSDSGIVGDRMTDFAGGLLRIRPTGTAPLLALSAGMKSEDVRSVIVTWFEESFLNGRNLINNNAGTGTTIIVEDASAIVPGSVQMIETTGEYIYVIAVAANTLTVIRGFAGTTNTTINGSSTAVGLQQIGTAHEEASAKPVSYAHLGYPVFNYMQIFRNAWDASGTAQASQWHTGDVIAKNEQDCYDFHARDIELSSFFGKKTIGVKNGKPFRMMDGLVSMIKTNVEAQSTSVSWVNLRDFLEVVFSRNIVGQPNERIAFCGNSVVGVLDDLARQDHTMNIVPGATEIGLKVMKLLTPFGDISLMTHPLFNESPVWNKMLLVMHPGAYMSSYLRKTRRRRYVADAGVDADFGTVTTEMSVKYAAEVTGGIFTGIDTATAAA